MFPMGEGRDEEGGKKEKGKGGGGEGWKRKRGVATRVSWSPLSGLKGVQPPLPFGEPPIVSVAIIPSSAF